MRIRLLVAGLLLAAAVAASLWLWPKGVVTLGPGPDTLAGLAPTVTVPLKVGVYVGAVSYAGTDVDPRTSVVVVPVYPGARKMTGYRSATEGVGLSASWKSASVSYVLPLSPKAAEAWYHDKLTRMGYQVVGEAPTLLQTSYEPVPSSWRPHLAVTCWPYGPDSTEVQIWILALVPPPRPATTLLPAGIDRVHVELSPDSGSNREWDVTEPATVQHIVGLFNQLTTEPSGTHGCLNGLGHLVVQFFQPSQAAVTASYSSCGPSILLSSLSNRALQDPDFTWRRFVLSTAPQQVSVQKGENPATTPTTVVSTVQEAVDAVFRYLGSGLDLPFPRSVGINDTEIPAGGRLGNKIRVTLETKASPLENGAYGVDLIRRFKFNGNPIERTWTYTVDSDGTVHDTGSTGSDLPVLMK